jgi:hypothetical protein
MENDCYKYHNATEGFGRPLRRDCIAARRLDEFGIDWRG